MKWVLIAVGVVVALILLVTVIGAFLPREHMASRAIVLRQPPETVWATIRNLEGIAAWFPEGARVKVEVAEERRPAKLVTRIVPERRAPFGGTWTYEIQAAPGGSRLTVTENGWIAVAPFRVVAQLMGMDATIKQYLTALAKKFGETCVLS